jgi:hypothetical protein
MAWVLMAGALKRGRTETWSTSGTGIDVPELRYLLRIPNREVSPIIFLGSAVNQATK